MNVIGVEDVVEAVLTDLVNKVHLILSSGDRHEEEEDSVIRQFIVGIASESESLANFSLPYREADSEYTEEPVVSSCCEKCSMNFALAVQRLSHTEVYHSPLSQQGQASVIYRCCSCAKEFFDLNLLLTHRSCPDKGKQRLGSNDACVCAICGFAAFRGFLYGHLISQHGSELKQKSAAECCLCTPPAKLKSKLDSVYHLATAHPTAFQMQLKKPDAEIFGLDGEKTENLGVQVEKEKEEWCYLCGTNVPVSKFASHVVSFHCNAEKADSTESRKRKSLEESNGNVAALVRQPRAKKSFPKKARKTLSPELTAAPQPEGAPPSDEVENLVCPNGCHTEYETLGMHRIIF